MFSQVPAWSQWLKDVCGENIYKDYKREKKKRYTVLCFIIILFVGGFLGFFFFAA